MQVNLRIHSITTLRFYFTPLTFSVRELLAELIMGIQNNLLFWCKFKICSRWITIWWEDSTFLHSCVWYDLQILMLLTNYLHIMTSIDLLLIYFLHPQKLEGINLNWRFFVRRIRISCSVVVCLCFKLHQKSL